MVMDNTHSEASVWRSSKLLFKKVFYRRVHSSKVSNSYKQTKLWPLFFSNTKRG